MCDVRVITVLLNRPVDACAGCPPQVDEDGREDGRGVGYGGPGRSEAILVRVVMMATGTPSPSLPRSSLRTPPSLDAISTNHASKPGGTATDVESTTRFGFQLPILRTLTFQMAGAMVKQTTLLPD